MSNSKVKVPEKLQKFKEELFTETKQIIHEFIPLKILSLDSLFRNTLDLQIQVQKQCESSIVSLLQQQNDNKENEEDTNSTRSPSKNRSKSKSRGNKSQSQSASQSPSKSKKRSHAQMREEDELLGESNATQVKVMSYTAPNVRIKEMHDIIQSEVVEFMDNLDKIVVFINLHVPKIEDGNNFGVEVQETIKSMVSSGSASAYNFLREIPKYHQQRARLIAKHMKYPGLDDYKRSILEVDSKHALVLQHTLRDLRNNYFVIYDVINKNWTRLIKPRGEKPTTFSMY